VTRKRTVFLLGVMALTLLWMSVADVCGQDYGARLGGRRGGEVTFEPKGPGVLFGALDPAVKKWYVPQELYQEYQWKSWEYTNYARTLYERYVDVALEGDYFYDLYGNFVTRGWLIYDWTQQQPQQFGSSVYKDNRYANWFSRVLIASDSKGQYHYAITIGDQLRTTLTPMTFSKPSYNGLQWDFLSDKYAATLLLSRVSSPGMVASIPTARTNNTNLMAGRVAAQVGDFVTVGVTYVNGHQSQTLLDSFTGSPFKGMLTDDQNGAPISWIEIVLSDDSPEDGEGGAAYFKGGSDIIIKDIHGELYEGKQIGFEPIVEGGFQRVGFLAADGEESIRIRYDFTDPSYNGPDKTEIREISFKLVLANDYRVEVTSDRQTNDENQPVRLLVTRASGNVKDNSNQRIVKFDYGLATATQIFGFTLEVTDVMGFNLYAEFDINHNYRQYPNVNFETHPTASGIVGDTESEAWMVNLSKTEYPWFFFAEAFSMDDGYRTDIFLVDDTGALDYEDLIFSRYEFVEDNDDQDRRPDWFRGGLSGSVDNEVFPGWDENNDFISDFNQNDNERRQNLFPDYEEPFLRYNVDRPEYLFGIDMNNNLWADRFENDEQADYPYKKDHQGYNLYVGTHLAPDIRLTVGQLREELLSADKQNVATYALFTLDRDYAGFGRLRLFERLKLVKDNIQDNLFQWVQPPQSRGTQQRLEDPLLAQNTWINTTYIGFDYTGIRNFRIINKIKFDWYKQRDPAERLALRDTEDVDRFLGIVNKADYTFDIAGIRFRPQVKSEFRRQTRDMVSDTERKEWTGLGFFILRFPVLRKTVIEAGVEGTIFNDMAEEGDANDFTGMVLALQFTNLWDYQGYRLTTQMGFKLDRKALKDQEAETTGQTFMTVFAGVEQ